MAKPLRQFCGFMHSAARTATALLFFFTLSSPLIAAQREARVKRVIDGDTFDTTQNERVRFIGLDAPEYQPHRNKIEIFGKESKDFLALLLTDRLVQLEDGDEPKDKYGRTLAYVYGEDGRMVNEIILEKGYARAKAYGINTRYQDLLDAAELRARREQKGIWARGKGSRLREILDKFLPRA